MKNSSNWTGRFPRTLNQAFGPYHSKNYKLYSEKKESPAMAALVLFGLAACWFCLFWVLGA